MDDAVDKTLLTKPKAADKRWLVFLLAGIALAVAVLTGLWYRGQIYPSTDDAYLNAHVIDIAAIVSGRVSEVLIKQNEQVNAGDALFRLDPRPFAYAVDLAQANLDLASQTMGASTAAVDSAAASIKEREASLTNAQAEADRVRALFNHGDAAKAQLDSAVMVLSGAAASLAAARADLSKAEADLGERGDTNAGVRSAVASLEQAQYNKEQAEMKAPTSGIIAEFNLRPGAIVGAGQALFHLVDTNSWWVDANFKETNLARMRAGMPAQVSLDMCPGTKLKGVVESISPGSGSIFSLFPAENATGNWVKVTQRFTVRVRIVPPPPAKCTLRIGASGRVTVDTSK